MYNKWRSKMDYLQQRLMQKIVDRADKLAQSTSRVHLPQIKGKKPNY